MAQSLHIDLQGPFMNLPFGICAIYFDLKVNESGLPDFKNFPSYLIDDLARSYRAETTQQKMGGA